LSKNFWILNLKAAKKDRIPPRSTSIPLKVSWFSTRAFPSNMNQRPEKKNTSVEISTPRAELRLTMATP